MWIFFEIEFPVAFPNLFQTSQDAVMRQVRQLQRGREQLIKEQKQLQEMQRALKKRQMHEQQVSLEALFIVADNQTAQQTACMSV